VYPRHCLRDPTTNEFFDEDGNKLSGPVPPVGLMVVSSYKSIDVKMSTALGLKNRWWEDEAKR